MKIFNFDEMAIFGPGSEWLWSMLQFVFVAITLLAMYRQLRAQAAANALARVEALLDRWHSRTMTRARLDVLLLLRYSPPARQMDARMDPIAQFFDVLYDLYRDRHLSIREIDSRFGGSAEIWWRLLRPAIESTRELEGQPAIYEGLEKLAALCGEAQARRGTPRTYFLDAPLPDLLDEFIDRAATTLRLLRDAQSDVIPQPPTDIPVSESS